MLQALKAGSKKINLFLKIRLFFPVNQPAQRDIIIVIMSRRQFPTDLRWILIYLNFSASLHALPFPLYRIAAYYNQYSTSVFTTLSEKESISNQSS